MPKGPWAPAHIAHMVDPALSIYSNIVMFPTATDTEDLKVPLRQRSGASCIKVDLVLDLNATLSPTCHRHFNLPVA